MDKEKLIKILIQKDHMLKRLYLEKEELNYYANMDVMTGVFNRRAGLELLNKEFNLSKKNKKNIVVCFIDVDRLKIINDTFGHEEGDKTLINAAKVLRESIRKTDFIIRMGGDEFLIVFPKTVMKEVNKIWYEVCKKVDKINESNDNYNHNLSFSYGFYECSQEMINKLSINDLIRKADEEMYKNKIKKRTIRGKYEII